jgi:hypothetical protein
MANESVAMPIHGVEPLDSDNAFNEFRSIAYSIVRRINYYVGGPSDPTVVENSVLGDLIALQALCRADKKTGEILGKAQVGEWRERFLKWLESAGPKIPVKHLEGYRESALALFDELEGCAIKKPKMLWETSAHPQGNAE